eukprot:2702746-Pleurochrysis_carterae.AAC.7
MTMIKQAGAVIAYRPLQLPAMGSRLLVILGEQDVQISVSDAHRHAAHAQARLLMLANAGHNCFVQCAAEATVLRSRRVGAAHVADEVFNGKIHDQLTNQLAGFSEFSFWFAFSSRRARLTPSYFFES